MSISRAIMVMKKVKDRVRRRVSAAALKLNVEQQQAYHTLLLTTTTLRTSVYCLSVKFPQITRYKRARCRSSRINWIPSPRYD